MTSLLDFTLLSTSKLYKLPWERSQASYHVKPVGPGPFVPSSSHVHPQVPLTHAHSTPKAKGLPQVLLWVFSFLSTVRTPATPPSFTPEETKQNLMSSLNLPGHNVLCQTGSASSGT